MARLVISYPDDLPPTEALDYVRRVVAGGRVSRARGRDQFCFLSVGDGIEVHARPLRADSAADSFDVRRIGGPTETR